ncbi:Hypp3176 [Branchiostoma lanceolatum]|uniref:Hypp3176 protein n=1 Tax=Branchiostoma lanceolatum TaxID=7740 RepID=A0A8K0EWN2_BRALA|nr:Hypp3176 [Branchiostoma lanceolatum]
MSLVERHFPLKVKSVRTNDKSWMTERVKRAISQRQAEFLRHGKSPLWKQLRNKVKTVVQQAKNWHYRNCIQDLKQENPRKWWSCINRELGRSQEKPKRSVADGTPEQVAETISQHFSEAWCQGAPLHMFPLPLGEPGPELCSIGEVKCLLKSVKPKKACGPDNLPNWILTVFADDLAPIIAHLFNTSYEEGTVPVAWKSANVVPVPKFAGASQARDMRPVSLLSVLAKLLERCILKRLLPSIQTVIKDQYAYVKGSSTTLALVRMVQTWLKAVDSNKPTLVRAIFADMSKAFDRVDHARLLQRVIDIHVSPCMQRWIYSYLQNRQQRVVADGASSSWRTLTSGVPQGGVLSPYLFLLFMSTRTTVHDDTMNVGYADDVSLSRTLSVPLADQDTTVEEESSNLNSWAVDNKMTLNGGKSMLLQICFSRSVPTPPTITLGGQPVPSVDCAKGLGFIIDKNLTFNEQVTSMISKASRRLHYLRLLTKQGTSVPDLIQIYLALVRPVLEYCHVLLVGCTKEQELAIERIQRRALRIISLGGRRSVPDLPTLQSRREEAAVNLFQRMLREDHPLHDLVPPTRTGATGRSLRNCSSISVPKARTKRLSNSFLHTAIRLYNNELNQ